MWSAYCQGVKRYGWLACLCTSLERHKPVAGEMITPEKVNATALAMVQLNGKPGKGPSDEPCWPLPPFLGSN